MAFNLSYMFDRQDLLQRAMGELLDWVHQGRLSASTCTSFALDEVAKAHKALESGKTVWTVQLPKSRDGFSSSPLVAGNHLYVTQENGTTYVIGPLDVDSPKLIATNTIGDSAPFTVASPIPVGNDLLLRSKRSLYRITGE